MRKANPTIIGGFVLGAIALVVIALAVLGGGRYFTHHPRAVAFFKGDIQGLAVGSPVTLRGVQIGTVTEIDLRLNVRTMEPLIPVYMEFDPGRLRIREESGIVTAAELEKQEPLKRAIANGLHASLGMQSLVTGQLLVSLDLDPNEARHLVGADPSTVEIPTSDADLTKLKNTLTQLPLDKLAETALKLLQDMDKVATSPDISQLLRSLATTSDGLDKLVNDARGDLPPIVSDLHDAMKSGRDALGSAQGAMVDLRATLKTADQFLATDAREAMRVAIAALQKADAALGSINGMIAANSSERYDLDQSLRNLTATTRSLRIFAEDLERRPSSLLTGK